MSNDNEANDSMDTPPSFIPASGRKKPASSSGRHHGVSNNPASFAPMHSNRASSAKQPVRHVEQPSSNAPQSFKPAVRTTAARRPSASASSSSPASFAPASTPRSTAPSQRVHGSSSVSMVPKTTNTINQSVSSVMSVPRKKHRIGHVILIIFLALALTLGLGVFSAWNWVNGQLNKQTWLTPKADTAGESWLILGSDEREGTIGDAGDVTGFRTDTILVLTKPKTGPSSLVSIPRDSLVEIDGSYMKINAVAQLYSRSQLVNEVEDITGQKINHVAMVRFGGLVKVVDALGGVDLCYDQDVSDPYSGLNWTAGCHTVDGNTALAFSRMRYADAQGDFGRAARQRQVINAIVKKSASTQTLTNFGKTKKIVTAALSSVTVDEKASTSSLLEMALAFKSASGKNGISGSVYWSDPDYYVDGVGSSVLLDDEKNTKLFSELANGTHPAGTVGTLAEQQN